MFQTLIEKHRAYEEAYCYRVLCLEQFSELLKHQLEQANDEYLAKGRMYRSVGLLGGIAAGIVIV